MGQHVACIRGIVAISPNRSELGVSMKLDKLTHPAHLFTVRVWLETLEDDETEWRGKVQHVLSGESHYFRKWSALTTHLLSMLQGVEDEE